MTEVTVHAPAEEQQVQEVIETPPTTAELLAKLGDLNILTGTEITGFGGGSY